MNARLAAALVSAVGLAATPAAAKPPRVGVVVLSPDTDARLAEDGARVVDRLSQEGWFYRAAPAQPAQAYEGCFRRASNDYVGEWDEACVRRVLDAAPADQPQVAMIFESTRAASSASRLTCLGRGARQAYREMVYVHDALGGQPQAGPVARVQAGRCLLSAVFDASSPSEDKDL